jgi:hypothetical protein
MVFSVRSMLRYNKKDKLVRSESKDWPFNLQSEAPFQNTNMSKRIQILVMDLEETEARNDCAGKDQQQFNWPIEEWVSQWVRGLLRFSRRELLLVEVGGWGWGQIGHPEEMAKWLSCGDHNRHESNNSTATEEQPFLCAPYWDVIAG